MVGGRGLVGEGNAWPTACDGATSAQPAPTCCSPAPPFILCPMDRICACSMAGLLLCCCAAAAARCWRRLARR